MFKNPFPEFCQYQQQRTSLALTGLHPLEVSMGNSFLSSERRAEYFSGRRCAHAVMVEEGYPALPVLRHLDRSPVWPLNIVGSITHGASLAAAIIKKRYVTNVLNIGIDIEDLSREIRTDISKTTLTDWERDRWSVESMETSQEARIIFSIKETIYKCFYPVHHVYLGFHDAEITELGSDYFSARLLKNPLKKDVPIPFELTGPLQVADQAVMSALLINLDQFLT